MIKKLLLAILLVGFLITPVYAGVTGGAKHLFDSLLVDDTATHFSTDTSDSSASGEFYVGDKTKVGFVVNYISCNAPTSFQVEVEVNTAAASDNTWAYADNLRTSAGDDSPAQAITVSVLGTGATVFYLPDNFPAQYVSVEVVGTGTSSTATFDVDVWCTWQTEN